MASRHPLGGVEPAAGGPRVSREDGSPAPLLGVGPLPAAATVHVYDHVYRLVRHAVLSGDLPPGTRVVEATLAEQLRVSRTPVRDALRRLEGDGLLERLEGGGLAVASFERSEVGDLFLVRLALDRLAADLAARRRSSGEWEPVHALVDELARVADRSGVGSYAFSEAHDRLHAAIYAMAFPPKVARILNDRLMGLVEIAGGLSYTDRGREEPVVRQHLSLVEALSSGDPKRAVAAMAEHVLEAERAAEEATGADPTEAKAKRTRRPPRRGG